MYLNTSLEIILYYIIHLYILRYQSHIVWKQLSSSLIVFARTRALRDSSTPTIPLT